MMAGVLSSLLADFSPLSDPAKPGIAILKPVAKPTAVPAPEPKASPVDQQADLIRRAEEKVRQEERDLAQERLQQALAAERTRFEEEQRMQRLIWTEQEALQLSSQFGQAFSNLEKLVVDKVANVLKPFVLEALQRQAIAEFEEALRTVLSGTSSRLISVSGPADLLSLIKTGLGARGDAIEFMPNDDVEVVAVAQDTVIATQLSSWSRRLDDILKEDRS